MPDLPVRECVYATAGWGIHDERWVAGLAEVGFNPSVISLGREAKDEEDLQRAVASASRDGRPILAGPLPTVARPLVDAGLRPVGLSWGYDLADAAMRPQDVTWLVRLRGLIVDSEANRELAEHAGLPASRITYLPWGIDLSTFVVDASRVDGPDLDVPESAPIVLSLRAHEATYRVEDILRAFALLPPLAVQPQLVVGHAGSLTADLRRLADELGIAARVRFIGTVPEHDLVPLMGRAACYVTASEVDGTSVTLLQAMACGTPVVASDTPGTLGWVEDGVTGFTFPMGDVQALASVLERILSSGSGNVTSRARAAVEAKADWHANLERLRLAMELP